jgi:PAS domain S-box-containing protein
LAAIEGAPVRKVPLLERLYIDLPAARSGSLGAYLLAAAIVAATLWFRLAIDPWVIGSQFIILLLGVMTATFVCGVGGGIFAAVLSILSAWYFILPPRFTFAPKDVLEENSLLAFAVVAAISVALVGLLRAALAHLTTMRALDIAIFDSNPEAIIVANEDGRITQLNDRAVALFGYSRVALLGRSIEDLVPDHLRSRHASHRATYGSDPQIRKMGGGSDFMAVRADGTEFPVEIHLGPIQKSGDSRFIANVRDVTEEKIAAAALAESRTLQAILVERQRGAEELQQANAKLSKIIESAPVAIWAIDSQDRFTIWNPAVEKIYGIAAADIVGESWRNRSSAWIPSDAHTSEELVKLAVDNDGFQDLEIRRIATDGSLHELSTSAALLRDAHDKVTGVLFIAHDIGQTKALEQRLRQSQKMEALGQLTGGVAHDFNNLLAIIYGNLELLGEQSNSDPLAAELIADALKAAEHGASLTHQLLAFSRQQQLAPSAVDIGELVVGTIGMLRRVLEESVDIVTKIAPDLRKSDIDSQQLANALLNLVINGRDAMPNGGTLTIAAENAILDDDYSREYVDVVAGRYVKLSISDTGLGMTKAVLNRVVEPFFTTKPLGRGTGLGLSMVYGFVKQSGGHLAIYSEPGLGTTVNLYLPEARSQMPAAVETGTITTIAGGQQVILVVEDEAPLRKLQIRALDSLGYRTLEAADGPSALKLLESTTRMDLLLTDIILPGGMSGPALAEAAGKLRPGLKIIFMSGYAPHDVIQRYDLQTAQCLSKPFTRASLARAIGEELEKIPRK